MRLRTTLPPLLLGFLTLGAVAAFGLPKRRTYSHAIHRNHVDERYVFRNQNLLYKNENALLQPFQRSRSALHDASKKQRKESAHHSDNATAQTSSMAFASPSSKRFVVALFALSSFSLVTITALLGYLPGPQALDGTVLPYAFTLIARDCGAAILCAILGYFFVKVNTHAAEKEWMKPSDSRKLIHTFSAPLYMLLWPVFSTAEGAKYFAAVVPLVNTVRLYLASTGNGEASLARAVSRSGNAKEALGGPFIYTLIMTVCIVAFWRDSPTGIVTLSTLAAGDGLADLLGRRFGTGNQWPGLEKSVAGTFAFWAGSTLTSLGLLSWMVYWDCLALSASVKGALFGIVAGISLVAAILELLPFGDDNYTVSIAALVLSIIYLQ